MVENRDYMPTYGGAIFKERVPNMLKRDYGAYWVCLRHFENAEVRVKLAYFS